MKLGALKSAIKDHEGAPKIRVNLAGAVPVEISVVKGSLLEALDTAFPGGRSVETGLYLRPTGFLQRESERDPSD